MVQSCCGALLKDQMIIGMDNCQVIDLQEKLFEVTQHLGFSSHQAWALRALLAHWGQYHLGLSSLLTLDF